MLTLDHIVVAAPSLAEGVAHVRDLTGLDMPKGGEHPHMGTHNHLLRLGSDTFLEVIAVNPDAPAPDRPRWFGLDAPVPQPRLAHWVVRCDDMAKARALLPDTLGPALSLTRGSLNWLLTVPDDGQLPMDGALPSLLEWQADPLPPTQMAGADADLTAFTITHPQADMIHETLAPHLDDPRITYRTGPLALEARITVDGREVILR
ncbi:VOC family protein [Pseudooceanicola onchidii]|uniref:VOC family protein n=1 Tax=Pseudooceanicola onchidii TaxID=2562279 RepID=UPI0010A9EF64|nr:VOC family protein [Pseudooceanicola onchidii]